MTGHSAFDLRHSTFASTVPVEAHRDRLLAVKRGELPGPEVNAWRKELHRDFERALAETKLPERPDYEAAKRFLMRARRSQAVRDSEAHSCLDWDSTVDPLPQLRQPVPVQE